MLDYDERVIRPETRRVPGENRVRAGARGDRVQMAVIAPNGRLSIVDAQADDLACDLLMERLDMSVEARFVPQID